MSGQAIGDNSSHSSPSPILRKEFTAKKGVTKARIYATSLGIHSLYLNGVNVAEEYFTPGWTALDDRITYLTYDVTRLVQEGANCFAAELGDGWTRGKLGFMNIYDNYGASIALLAQLEITYTDGSTEVQPTKVGEFQLERCNLEIFMMDLILISPNHRRVGCFQASTMSHGTCL